MNSPAHSDDSDKPVVDKHGLASVTLSVNWSDQRASHEEQLRMEKFSVRREADTLPPDIALNIPGMRAGEEVQAMLQAFMAGLLPYPFGLLVLSAFIAARIFQIS